jgi:hypothetical protein
MDLGEAIKERPVPGFEPRAGLVTDVEAAQAQNSLR